MWVLVLAVAAVLGLAFLSLGTAYLVGLAQGERERQRLVLELEAAREEMRAAVARAAALEERLVRATRNGAATAPARPILRPELEPLLPLLERRLTEGVPAERLARAIRAVPRERVCDVPIESRTVPVAITPNREVGTRSFAQGRFTVTARGTAAKSPSGRTEAWFDPTQPVELTIREAGKEPHVASGPLPLHYALVVERREYRFLARAGERRGTIEVQLEVCDYP